jgi:hypothetical protein
MTMLGQSRDGLIGPLWTTLTNRRRWLQVGAVALAGLGPLRALRARAVESLAPVRSCILVFYQATT